MTLSPVVEWRNPTTPFAVVTTQAMTGTGFGGAIPVGANSSQVTLRLYNNFAGAASIADAVACVLAVYDDTIHQGQATSTATTGLYVQVQCTDYNGSTTGADTQFYAIGGSIKHLIPVNSGTIGGATANYVTVVIQIAAPSTAMQGFVSQGLWLEYTSTA
jgi:hypothetical protein